MSEAKAGTLEPKLRDMEPIGTVYRTTDYDSFKTVPGNRSIARITKLRISIQDNGQLQPILVSRKLEVIDGQHRLYVCRDLGLPIEFIIKDQLDRESILPINRDRKNWQLKNYLDFNIDKKPYREFAALLKQSGLSINTLYAILKSKELSGKDLLSFQEGDFDITQSELGRYDSVITRLIDILEVNDGQYRERLKRTRAMPALVSLLLNPSYEHDHFMERLANAPGYKVKSVNTKYDAKLMLEEIYNYKLGKARKIEISLCG